MSDTRTRVLIHRGGESGGEREAIIIQYRKIESVTRLKSPCICFLTTSDMLEAVMKPITLKNSFKTHSTLTLPSKEPLADVELLKHKKKSVETLTKHPFKNNETFEMCCNYALTCEHNCLAIIAV